MHTHTYHLLAEHKEKLSCDFLSSMCASCHQTYYPVGEEERENLVHSLTVTAGQCVPSPALQKVSFLWSLLDLMQWRENLGEECMVCVCVCVCEVWVFPYTQFVILYNCCVYPQTPGVVYQSG